MKQLIFIFVIFIHVAFSPVYSKKYDKDGRSKEQRLRDNGYSRYREPQETISREKQIERWFGTQKDSPNSPPPVWSGTQNGQCDCNENEIHRTNLALKRTGAAHENDMARVILMHAPSSEVEVANFHPDSALFSNPVNWVRADRQHKGLVRKFRAKGIEVILVEDALLDGTLDADLEMTEGPALDQLREFAGRYLAYDTSALRPEFDTITKAVSDIWSKTDSWPKMQEEFARVEPTIAEQYQEDYRAKVLSKLPPQSLVDIILNRPTVELHLQQFYNVPSGNIHLKLDQNVTMRPLMNLYFSRDQMMTTRKGIVLTRPSLNQRSGEPEVLDFVLNKLGVPVLGALKNGFTDGGDFIMAGKRAMHGVGLRSSEEAPMEMMKEDWYGTEEVAVVKDYLDHNMDRMHLDTVFNILSEHQVLVLEDVLVNPGQRRMVDVYRKMPKRPLDKLTGEYHLVERDVDFERYLKHDMGMEITTVSNEEQLLYAINFLNLGGGQIMAAYDEPGYLERLRALGIRVDTAKVEALTDGYGGIHCMTQVVSRRG